MSSTRGIFPGYVSDEGLVSFDKPSEVHKFNAEHFGDHEVFVEIYVRRSKRSLKQNSAFHASIGPLAEELGYTVEELKLVLLGGCFGWKLSLGGVHIPEKLHTSQLDTQQFADLMAYTMQVAAEQGVVILDPSQWKSEQRKKLKRAG